MAVGSYGDDSLKYDLELVIVGGEGKKTRFAELDRSGSHTLN